MIRTLKSNEINYGMVKKKCWISSDPTKVLHHAGKKRDKGFDPLFNLDLNAANVRTQGVVRKVSCIVANLNIRDPKLQKEKTRSCGRWLPELSLEKKWTKYKRDHPQEAT